MLAPIGAGSCFLAKGAFEVYVSAYRRWFMFLGQGCLGVFLAKVALEVHVSAYRPREPWKFMLGPLGACSCSLAKAALEVHVRAYRRWFMFLGQGSLGSSR